MPVVDFKLPDLPIDPGVYWMKDRMGHLLYVGKAKNLKKRVSSYFQPGRQRFLTQPKIKAMLTFVASVDWMVTQSEAEALLLEGKLIKEWKPKYNTDFTDDKHFLSVKVDLKATWPRFRLVRHQSDDGALYFGPFAHSQAIRNILQQLKKSFGVLSGDDWPKPLGNGLYCLYDDMRADIYGALNEVTIDDYGKRVQKACDFLKGKIKDYRASVKEKMMIASDQQLYEKAAQLRDQLQAIDHALSPTRRFKKNPSELTQGFDYEGLTDLSKALDLSFVIDSIEGFDISHISGTFTVASMVRFEGGKPVSSAYRRYKIKSFEGNDDFKAMSEVVDRRYSRLYEEKKPLPDLILIDGGLGQVHAALKAFEKRQWSMPLLVGLAKKEETIIFSDGRHLQLPLNHLGIQLLQRVRDEAHRFANHYSAHLRSKKLKISILEGIPGLGPKKQQRIWERFPNIKLLKSASIEALEAIPGINKDLAVRIKNVLSPE